MKQILFITSTRIGDAVLSTGILNYLCHRYPKSEITVACGPLVQGFFTACPNVKKVIALNKEKNAGHWRKLWRACIGTRWYMVVDLRNSAVSRLLWAKHRHIFGSHIDDSLHKAHQNASVLGLYQTPDLKLWLSDDVKSQAAQIIPDGTPVLGIGPAANWHAKTWPHDRFIDLINRLTGQGGVMQDARVAIIAAPGEEDVARAVYNALPADRRIDIIAKGRPELAAACVARCTAFIGNDSGLAHAAAAANIPVLALFGPSWPHIYSPYGAKAAYVATPQNFAQLTAYPGYTPSTAPCLMDGLTTDAVEAAANQLLTQWIAK